MALAASRSEASLRQLREELDPGGRHGPRKVVAALRAVGLEPEDVQPVTASEIKVDGRIPEPARAERVKQQRKDVWEGLRESRLGELRDTLEGLGDDDARRYERAGDGVRAVRDNDLPPVDDLVGMDDFAEVQERKRQLLKAEQQRKADLLVSGFLTEKKRMDEADEKIASFERRLADRRKEQAAERAARRKEATKLLEKRQVQVNKSAEERLEWEDETERKTAAKLERAAATRAQALSKDGLRSKMEASNSKRQEAYLKALDLEESRLADVTRKQEALDVRLEERRQQVEDELQLRAEASQARFHKMQLQVYAAEEEWAEAKLARHAEFQANVDKVRAQGRANLLARSKSCATDLRKANDKWRSNHEKQKAGTAEAHGLVMERHQKAAAHTEAVAPLKLKCGNDVFTNQEVKYNTWGELQKRRYKQLAKSRDAHTQALVFEIAEFDRKTRGQQEAREETKRRRQLLAKESLLLNDRAKEGFLKIKCEPDERRIRATMAGLGFSMPKIEREADEKEAEDAKPNY